MTGFTLSIETYNVTFEVWTNLELFYTVKFALSTFPTLNVQTIVSEHCRLQNWPNNRAQIKVPAIKSLSNMTWSNTASLQS